MSENIIQHTAKLPLNSLTSIRAKKAIHLLKNQICKIPDVKTWARETGVSRRWLCKSMKAVYGKPPKIILREVKYEKIVLLIREEGVDATCYSVAVDTGFGKAKNGSRFLSSHYDTTFTELKMDLLKENVQIDFQWYNGSK